MRGSPFASVGISQIPPIFSAPGTRPSSRSCRTRRSDTPSRSAASAVVQKPFTVPLSSELRSASKTGAAYLRCLFPRLWPLCMVAATYPLPAPEGLSEGMSGAVGVGVPPRSCWEIVTPSIPAGIHRDRASWLGGSPLRRGCCLRLAHVRTLPSSEGFVKREPEEVL